MNLNFVTQIEVRTKPNYETMSPLSETRNDTFSTRI